MAELSLDITEEILVRLKVKDLIKYKLVCKSWNSLVSSDCFVKSHLNYNLKKNADNTETGDTRIVLADPSSNDYKCDIVGSSNGLVCLRFGAELLVVNPSTRQVKKIECPPQIPDFTCQAYVRLGFGYDSSIDDFKVIVGFRKRGIGNKYHFLASTLKSKVWRSVSGEFDYSYMFINGVLCNGAIHWLATDGNNNSIVVSFDISKEVIKEIFTPMALDCGKHNLGTMKDRLCIFRCSSRTPFDQPELWVMKNNYLQESESIWEQMLSLLPCDDSGHEILMDYIPRKSFTSHRIHIWMLEEDSEAPVYVESVESPHGKAHIFLSTNSECNYNYDGHVFVESLVSPHGICNEGRVTRKMHNMISTNGDGRSVNSKRRQIIVSPDRDCIGSGNGEESQTKKVRVLDVYSIETSLRVKNANDKDGSARGSSKRKKKRSNRCR